MKKILFLHGFFASGQCIPALALRESFENRAELITPDIPIHPKVAINFIRDFTEQNPELNPFSKLFAGLDSDYLITLNIGGIWNVISLWVRRGMKDDPEEVKAAIKQYLARIGTI